MSQVIVVDNFYADPDRVRALALRAQFRDVTRLNYPGFQSLKSYSSAALAQRIAEITACDVEIRPDLMTFGVFRIMLKEISTHLNVHVDGLSDWTGVLYLNPPEHCLGGTAFYRHKATGVEGTPNAEQLSELGFATLEEFNQKVVRRDTNCREAWEVSQFVAMQYNRLALFRGNQLFHGHTESFGTNFENGRLTQNFFFNEVKSSARVLPA